MRCPIKCPEMVWKGVKKEQFRTLVEIQFLQVSHRFLCQDVSYVFSFYVSCLVNSCQVCTSEEDVLVSKDKFWKGCSITRQGLKRIQSEKTPPEKETIWKDTSWKGSRWKNKYWNKHIFFDLKMKTNLWATWSCSIRFPYYVFPQNSSNFLKISLFLMFSHFFPMFSHAFSF